MSANIKGLLHTVLSILALYVPTLLISSHVADVTIGGIVAWILNYALSYTVATTTGKSTLQGNQQYF